jgi:MFS family permease
VNQQTLSRIQFNFTAIVSIATWALLLWQYFHEGVPSHHLLHRADLPAISNWWGALLLPLLSWFGLAYIHKSLLSQEQLSEGNYPIHIIISFIAAAFYGGLIAIFFMIGKPEISAIMFQGILVLALFFPVYRVEYLLGFILSMSFAFGAVLPTGFGVLIAFASAILHHLVRFVVASIGSRFARDNKH